MLFSPIMIILVAAATQLASASPMEKSLGARQTISGGLIAFFKVLIKGAIDGDPPVCDTDFSEGETYQLAIGQDHNGNWFEICWRNDTDLVTWDQATADAANCLTNLHYTQASTCISVEGSSCDNGYIDGGGRLQNLRESNVIGSGSQSSSQISADESVTYQAAWNSIIGQSVTGLGTKGPYVYTVTDDTGSTMQGNIEMQANFQGENAC